MDGEVNNRTARIAQDVKRDRRRRDNTDATDAGDTDERHETDETDKQDGRRKCTRDAGDRQTQEIEKQHNTLKGVRRNKEG